MSVLDLQNITKSYGDKLALAPLDLQLHSGELVTLLGPSGCGKTTLLRIVAGFLAPDAGRILLGERDLTSLPPQSRDMGMVFQAYSLFPNMTAAQNIAFGLDVRRMEGAQKAKRVQSLLELVGLSDFGNRYPSQLSGGQQQRVALARALAIQPKVLLLDEPLSALDAQVRVALRDEIRRIQQEMNTTTLFVTHDQEEALAISDRVVVMNAGKIAQVGQPTDIYRRPANVFVAEFIGNVSGMQGKILNPHDGLIQIEGLPHPIKTQGALPWAAGTSVRVYLRPEELRIEDTPDAISMEILQKRFLGAVTRVTFGSGSLSIDVDFQGLQAEALSVGQRLPLHIPAGAVHVIADTP